MGELLFYCAVGVLFVGLPSVLAFADSYRPWLQRWYRTYALVLGAASAVVLYYGIGFAETERIRDVPKSVRYNPGSYRSHYSGYVHYHGGK